MRCLAGIVVDGYYFYLKTNRDHNGIDWMVNEIKRELSEKHQTHIDVHPSALHFFFPNPLEARDHKIEDGITEEQAAKDYDRTVRYLNEVKRRGWQVTESSFKRVNNRWQATCEDVALSQKVSEMCVRDYSPIGTDNTKKLLYIFIVTGDKDHKATISGSLNNVLRWCVSFNPCDALATTANAYGRFIGLNPYTPMPRKPAESPASQPIPRQKNLKKQNELPAAQQQTQNESPAAQPTPRQRRQKKSPAQAQEDGLDAPGLPNVGEDGQASAAIQPMSDADHNDYTCDDINCEEPHPDVRITPTSHKNMSYTVKSNMLSPTAGKQVILTNPKIANNRCHYYKRKSATEICPKGENCINLHLNGSAVGDKAKKTANPARKRTANQDKADDEQGNADGEQANADDEQGNAGSSAEVSSSLDTTLISVNNSAVDASNFVMNAGLRRALSMPTPRGAVCTAKHDASKTDSCTFLHYRSAEDGRAAQQQDEGNEEVVEEAPSVAASHSDDEQAQEDDEWHDAAEDVAEMMMAEMQVNEEHDFEELASMYEVSVEDLDEGYRVYGNVGGAIEYATNRRDEQ